MRRPPATTRRDRLGDALHVFVLAGFALAQPLYDLLARSPEFFLVRRATLGEVLLAPLLFSIGLPAALVGLELVAGFLGVFVRRAVHTVVVALLAAIVALPLAVRFVAPLGTVPLLVALGAGALFVTAYHIFRPVRMFTTALAPAVLIFPTLYLARTWVVHDPPSAQRVAPVAPPTVDASVVVVVLDELGLGSLLGQDGAIDAAAFPAFGRLAAETTWFRNATTVASATQAALPALLTGRLPGPGALVDPVLRARNLFTLLAPSHALAVVESYVPFCPGHLCGAHDERIRRPLDLAADLAIVALRSVLPLDRWVLLPEIDYGSMLVQPGTSAAEFGAMVQLFEAQRSHETAELTRRARTVAEFIARLGRDPRPTLHYLHVMLPHEPSVHLPSGAICANDRRREPSRWPAAASPVARAYQRHLLQVQFVDGLIGRLIDRLEATGAWNSTLLVVTADHGVSFRPGDLRRALSATNECDVLGVPLFVKGPGQRAGGPSDRNVESIDVLPTIAALLGVPVPWPMDGQPATTDGGPGRASKVVTGPSWPAEQTLFADAPRRELPADFGARCGAPEHARAWFGRDAAGRTQPFAIGPHRELLGRRVSELAADGAASHRVVLADAGRYEAVAPASGVLPCPIAGRIVGATAAEIVVAVALDGVVQAVTETRPAGRDAATFSVLVPETAFRAGRNEVSVHRVVGGAEGSVRLERLRAGEAGS